MSLLEIEDLHKHFPVGKQGIFGKPAQWLHAVDGVSLELERGETLGLVGESGCGKSTAARVITGLHTATSGSVRYEGTELTTLTRREWIPFRRKMQMIFQDPYASLDPRHTVESIPAPWINKTTGSSLVGSTPPVDAWAMAPSTVTITAGSPSTHGPGPPRCRRGPRAPLTAARDPR